MTDQNLTRRRGGYGPMPPGTRPWLLLWVYYLDSVENGDSSQNLKDALAEEVGDTFEGFVRAVRDGLLVISSLLRDDGLWYSVGVRVSDGTGTIANVHSMRLGLDDPETLALETAWALREHGPRLN